MISTSDVGLEILTPKIRSCVLFNGASQAPQMNLFLKRLIFFSCLLETIIFYNFLLFLHEFSIWGCDFILSSVSFTYSPKILVYSYFSIYLIRRSDRRYLYLYFKDFLLVHDTLLWFLVELWFCLYIYWFIYLFSVLLRCLGQKHMWRVYFVPHVDSVSSPVFSNWV